MVFVGLPLNLTLIGLALAGIVILGASVLQVGRAGRASRATTYGLRFLAVLLVMWVLREPVAYQDEPLDRQSFLVHTYDVSGSMSITDMDSRSRLDCQEEMLRQGSVRTLLDRRHRAVEFVFANDLKVQADTDPLHVETEAGTDLTSLFRSLAGRLQGLPVSAVLLSSDGNPSIGPDPQTILDAAVQMDTPVYTIGVAPKPPAPDVWIEEVQAPSRMDRNATHDVSILVGTRGLGESATQGVEVVLTENDREVDRLRVYPTRDRQVLPARFQVQPRDRGWNSYRVTLTPSPAESYPWNNTHDFLVQVVDHRRRVLYVEGYPRHEYRFLRAAFAEDARFEVASLVYLDQKRRFYRQGIRDQEQLKEGFPKTEDELFAYDVVVLGDVSADLFDERQFECLRDFVKDRGGGLLFLGGDHSFDPQGFARTALADVLPFRIGAGNRVEGKFGVVPTVHGLEQALFGPYDPADGTTPPWSQLPATHGLFTLEDLKPGALALARLQRGPSADQPALVAYQRYGRGISVICGISGTWQWKFQMPSDNTLYQTFWKQMILILMNQTRPRLTLKAHPPSLPLGDEVVLSGQAFDPRFQVDPHTNVELTIESPDGSQKTQRAESVINEGTTYQYRFTPTQAGRYQVTAHLESAGTDTRHDVQSAFHVTSTSPERQIVNLNETLLRDIANSTGGAYVHVSETDTLPDLIKPGRHAIHRTTRISLWDRPWNLGLLLGLLLAEWGIRRWRGMA